MLHRFVKYLSKNQVILALFLVCAAWLVVQLREILVSVFLAYIIMAAVLPISEYLRKNRVPKVLSVLIPYLIILFSILLLVFPLVPFLFAQIQSLAIGFPQYLNKSASIMGFSINPTEIEKYLNSEMSALSKDAFNFTTKVFGGFLSLITVFIVSFYLLMYYESFKRFIASFFQKESRESVLETFDRVNEKLGAWLQGQILLSLFIGAASWIALTILGLPYALPLALLAGMLEIIPTLGPTLSAIPAVIVALTVSPATAITVAAIYFVIQFLEGHFLVPKIMQRAVGLNPVVIILGVMIGANLMGIAGALLAIPFISFVIVIFHSLENS